jgi:DNA polymerase I
MTHQQDLLFMLIDLDYKIKETDESPTIRLFGKTEEELVLITIKDFLPYFYVTWTKKIDSFIEQNTIVSKWKKKIEKIVKKRYFGGEELTLLKIYGSHPEDTPKIREQFEQNGFEIHEADIPFVKRFLLDVEIGGLNILKAKNITYQKKKKIITANISYKDIFQVPKEEIGSADYFFKLKLMAFDIEVDHQTETMQQLLLEKEKRIVAISCAFGTNQYENTNGLFILRENSDADEKRIISEFISVLQDVQPDVLITFNGDNFDLPYLLGRMDKLAIPSKLLSTFQDDSVFYSNRYRCFRIKGRISYDISPRTWGIHPISGKKGLGDIAETIMGKGKIEVDRPIGEIWRSGFLDGKDEDKEKIIEYSLNDSILTYELLWKLGVQGWLEVIRLTGYPPGEAPGSTERIQGEFELMRFAGKQEVLIPSAPSDNEVARRRIERQKNPHTGGTVLVPKGTLHIGVIITDFRSMYPSVCVSHNIGGEVLKKVKDLENVDPLNLFHEKPQSCLSLMQETLIQRRELTKEKISSIDQELINIKNKENQKRLITEREILDKEQYSMKIVANSMYGAHNYLRSRFYSITLGNAITNIARTYILRMEKLLEKVSKQVTPVEIVYGDTDSAFIKIKDESLVTDVFNEKNPKKKESKLNKLIKITNKILLELNKQFPEAMELTLEDIAYKLIFKPKRAKAYSYYSILRDKLKITGFEAVRSDWSQLSRDSQREVLQLILKEPAIKSNKIEKEFEDPGIRKAKDYLIQLSISILKMPADKLIPKAMILSPIKKDPREYKSKMPAVQAFLNYAEKENLDPHKAWKEYDKFPWVIIPGKGIISDRARHPKYVTDLDRDHYITEILRASEGFGVKISLQDVKNIMTTEPIDVIFQRIEETQSKEIKDDEDNSDWIEDKKISKQTKISKFLKKEDKNK